MIAAANALMSLGKGTFEAMRGEDEDRQTKSRRFLEQVAREAEIEGMGRQARLDMSAKSADQEDRAEYWGTTIVRGLGVLLLIGLMAWIILSLLLQA